MALIPTPDPAAGAELGVPLAQLWAHTESPPSVWGSEPRPSPAALGFTERG